MSLKDFSGTYCPQCSAGIDSIQDHRPEECPFCKGIIKFDDIGGTTKGFKLQDVLLVLLVLVAMVIAYVWGRR